jgi:hypothetical protein
VILEVFIYTAGFTEGSHKLQKEVSVLILDDPAIASVLL